MAFFGWTWNWHKIPTRFGDTQNYQQHVFFFIRASFLFGLSPIALSEDTVLWMKCKTFKYPHPAAMTEKLEGKQRRSCMIDV